MAKFLGIEWNLSGEDPMNEKLDRFHQLEQAARDWPDLEPDKAQQERLSLHYELIEKDIIQYQDEPKQSFWGKLFG
jgi:hypothetical protein